MSKKRFTVMLDDDLIQEFKISTIVNKDDVQEIVTQMIKSYLKKSQEEALGIDAEVPEIKATMVNTPEAAVKAAITRLETKGKMVTPLLKNGGDRK